MGYGVANQPEKRDSVKAAPLRRNTCRRKFARAGGAASGTLPPGLFDPGATGRFAGTS